ncbi:MAG: acyltransferase domain-containing protein [Myxococcota bacterium]
MFSGQGSQYYQMGAELYRHSTLFRHTMQKLDAMAERHLGESVIHALYDAGHGKSQPFIRTRITHQAIFMVQYALSQVLLADGVRPSVLVGASLGEVSAAAVSGMLSVDECIALLFEHARLLESRCERGGMVAVLDSPELYWREPRLFQHCEMASLSGPSHFVIAGDSKALAQAAEYLTSRAILHRALPVEYAFHSSWLEPSGSELCSFLATLDSRTPDIPTLSCATAQPVEAMTGDHIWRVFRGPIRFLDTVCALEERGSYLYVDAGPSGTLAALIRPTVAERGTSAICATITPFGKAVESLARAKTTILGENR